MTLATAVTHTAPSHHVCERVCMGVGGTGFVVVVAVLLMVVVVFRPAQAARTILILRPFCGFFRSAQAAREHYDSKAFLWLF